MQFAVESWDPEYGTGGDSSALDASTDVVNIEVEHKAGSWVPLTPAPERTPETIYFVDGVRRIDARIWVTDNDLVLAGSCATVAAGVVACSGSRAEVVESQVLRGVFTPPAESAGPIVTGLGTYEYFPVKTGSPEDLYLGIHEQMTNLETRTIPNVGPNDLVVFDGPLRGRSTAHSIGLIKTQHVQYLPDDEQRVVSKLDAGQRTPLFLIGSRGFTRWSWYLRLPGPRTHGWAGIVRCELPGAGTVDEASAMADAVSAVLPRFASEPHKEARAPQNLYPIKGLEIELRRRLGDQRLLQRALRTAALTTS
ncbi:MAG: hypothetical protein HKN94_13380 [Acidimicrobiales bacterium]|nr:hypothetical protein [Acidimicrobiales bacterium]RZV48116.1 MAG: hypothetical protein EX269_03015 [Acidimicrobiales bacterium]